MPLQFSDISCANQYKKSKLCLLLYKSMVWAKSDHNYSPCLCLLALLEPECDLSERCRWSLFRVFRLLLEDVLEDVPRRSLSLSLPRKLPFSQRWKQHIWNFYDFDWKTLNGILWRRSECSTRNMQNIKNYSDLFILERGWWSLNVSSTLFPTDCGQQIWHSFKVTPTSFLGGVT